MGKQQKCAALGLDVGAIAVKVVFSGADGIVHTSYRIHHGEPEASIAAIIAEFGEPETLAVTGSGGLRIAKAIGAPYIDPAVALVAAARGIKNARHIIDIGGSSLSIVDLDEKGRFAGFRTNSLCAAGTGSFLDEQAARMKFSDKEKAMERSIKDPPRIAARCAVFAKSDLIHRQQEGFSIPEMWSGLCRGMVETALSTLFRGRRPQGPVIFAGGVACNLEVVRWIRNQLEAELIVPSSPETFSAGGALFAAKKTKNKIDWRTLNSGAQGAAITRRSKLEILKSDYPDFSCREQYLDSEDSLPFVRGGSGCGRSTSPGPSLQGRGSNTGTTEVRLHADLAGDVVIGIDIGSTSTKAAVVDMDGRVIADFYRRTSGDPIGATQQIFSAITKAARGQKLNVRGAGTTGSGRKMVGNIIGADLIINEITAHVRGAVATAPDVETIFEIGGQDSKFVSLKDGAPIDSNMNYVCAAGTGSFVEEQANKLGFVVTEIGDAVIGTEPPFSSDRCTVFMEQDVHTLIRAGFSRHEVMGSVLYSVVQNYLNKVVGRRSYSKKRICFMGATARNRGLVAAFEKLTGAPIAVSPYCHVMGAYGVARIVLDEIAIKESVTTFRGLSFADERVNLTREECALCSNRCRITRAIINDAAKDSSPSWGYLCGRDPDEKTVRVNSHFEPFRKRDRIWKKAILIAKKQDLPLPTSPYKGEEKRHSIGLPQALLFYSELPLWRKFFTELGIETVISKQTHENTLSLAADWIGSDYCYPLKLAHGHIRELSADDRVSSIFLPYVVQGEPHDDGFTRSVFCPYNIAFPSIAKEAGLSEPEEKHIIRPVINFQWSELRIASSLREALFFEFDLSEKDIVNAWHAAKLHMREFEKSCLKIGEEELSRINRENGHGIVILGRPYNVYDSGSNLNLPQKIADIGLFVLSLEMLPLSDVSVPDVFHNMYWRYGRKILQAAKFVAENERLHAVYLTNFGCGPDSFLQTYVEKIMRGKPMLMLELDEHTADAGYITRLEAFRDVIKNKITKSKGEHKFCNVTPGPETTKASHYKTLWIPPMHPYGSPLLAAALRSVGTNAQPIPPETVESFSRAKSFCRGTECVPAPATIGAFLHVLANSDAPEREALFMPSAKGPCRFGQYHTLHRLILDEAGYKDTHIEAWSDESGTYGTGLRTSRRIYNALVASDLLFKARCRVRPYAKNRAEFDLLMETLLARMTSVIEKGLSPAPELTEAARRISSVQRNNIKKPLVGVVGEIYVRLNTFTNGHLVETIEDAGGEAWVAPMTEWMQYLAFLDKVFAREDSSGIWNLIKKNLKNSFMMHKERALTKLMMSVIGDRLEPLISSTLNAGSKYLPKRFDGESILTIGRAIEFAHQGASLIINCAPFGCMPGTLTSGMFQKIEREIGVPIVSLFFDGEADLSHLVRTYISNVKELI